MVSQLNLTMLGTTGTGKTCFMLAMHAVGQSGIKAGDELDDPTFFLQAKERNENIELGLAWNHLRKTVGKDRWPVPNAATFVFHTFQFCVGAESLAEFKWLDYRGGALVDLNQSADVDELIRHARSSDGMIICLPGDQLMKPLHVRAGASEAEIEDAEDARESARFEAEVNEMNRLLREAQQEYVKRNKRPFPVIVAITKFDFCAESRLLPDGTVDDEGIVEDIKILFPHIFQRGQNCHVLIAPVSLGKELAKDQDNGKIRPRNMDMPIVFMCFSFLEAEVERQKLDLSIRRGTTVANRPTTFFGRLFRESAYLRELSELDQIASTLKKPEETLQKLEKILYGAHIYLDGVSERQGQP